MMVISMVQQRFYGIIARVLWRHRFTLLGTRSGMAKTRSMRVRVITITWEPYLHAYCKGFKVFDLGKFVMHWKLTRFFLFEISQKQLFLVVFHMQIEVLLSMNAIALLDTSQKNINLIKYEYFQTRNFQNYLQDHLNSYFSKFIIKLNISMKDLIDTKSNLINLQISPININV